MPRTSNPASRPPTRPPALLAGDASAAALQGRITWPLPADLHASSPLPSSIHTPRSFSVKRKGLPTGGLRSEQGKK